MESPETYIAMDRRLAMAHGLELPDRTQGSALFADISGFTPLTEAMARELGPKRGAEEVSKQLNVVFSALIAEVDRYRGSVISFSGDAITCWLNGDTGSRAVTCALAMQEVMRQFATVRTPSGTTVSLAIKVSIASGPVRRFRVGDPRVQYIDALAGTTLYHLAAAEHKANKGEVLVTEDVVDAIGTGLDIAEWRSDDTDAPADASGRARFAVVRGLAARAPADPWPEMSSAALTEEQVRPWLLPVIYERIKSGQDQFLAELRPAVALFLRFGGIDYDDDPAAGQKLDAFIQWAQGIVARYEGTMVQLTIGDKGSYLYSAFGAPLAHDDDPVRAVAAASELRAPPADLSFISSVQVGINRGRMRTGPYGGPTRRTYAVMSDAVNLAARLMSRAAPGEILVSQPIADAVTNHFDLHFVGPARVMGRQEPVLISQVIGRRAADAAAMSTRRFTDPLIGRERELEQLAQLRLTVLQAKGLIVRLEGPPGVGKSHLASAMAEQAAVSGLRVALGLCQGANEGTAYAPWRQVFVDLLELPQEGAADAGRTPQVEAVQTFVTRTNPDWLLRLPLLGDLLGLPIPDNATTAAFEPRLRQSALFDLAIEMVQHWAHTQPLLFLIDDVDMMDEASRGLTVALARAMIDLPIQLTLVHRPTMQDMPILPELDRLAYHYRLDLNELSPEGVRTLIAYRLRGQPGPLALSLIQAETQGNPFFVEELVDALRESGHLYRRVSDAPEEQWVLSERMVDALQQANCLTHVEDHWEIAPDANLSTVDLGLPDSIQGIVLSRIDRLPESPKLTLKVASVVGAAFALDVVAQAHPLQLSDESLQREAELLEVRDFTRLEPPQRRTYVFRHMVTHDVAYETLLFGQRNQLHRAVSHALERLAPDAIPQLAYHAFLGEDWPRALHYQFSAGQEAKRLFANQEGIEHLRKALYCADNLPETDTLLQRQQINAMLGELLTTIGQYEQAQEHLNKARALAMQCNDHDAQALACRWLARVEELRGAYAPAFEWIRVGLETLEGRATAEAAQLHLIAGLIHSRQGHHDQAFGECKLALQIAQNVNELSVQARAYLLLGHLTHLRGDSLVAIMHFQRALEVYKQAGDIQAQAMAYNLIANAHLVTGEWSSAETSYRQASRIFRQVGDIYNLAITDNNLGEVLLKRGGLEAATGFYQEALRLMQQSGGSLYIVGILRNNLGAVFIRRADIASARQHLQASQSYFEQVQARDFLPELNRHLAEAALVNRELPEANAAGFQALTLARELNMRSEEGDALRIIGEIACAEGRLEEAEKHLTQSVAVLEEVGHEYELALSRLALSRVYLQQGRRADGLTTLDRSILVLQRLGAALDLNTAQTLRQGVE